MSPAADITTGVVTLILALAAPLWLWRAFRGHPRSRGFCFRCGYDLRASRAAHCSECGSPVLGPGTRPPMHPLSRVLRCTLALAYVLPFLIWTNAILHKAEWNDTWLRVAPRLRFALASSPSDRSNILQAVTPQTFRQLPADLIARAVRSQYEAPALNPSRRSLTTAGMFGNWVTNLISKEFANGPSSLRSSILSAMCESYTNLPFSRLNADLDHLAWYEVANLRLHQLPSDYRSGFSRAPAGAQSWTDSERRQLAPAMLARAARPDFPRLYKSILPLIFAWQDAVISRREFTAALDASIRFDFEVPEAALFAGDVVPLRFTVSSLLTDVDFAHTASLSGVNAESQAALLGLEKSFLNNSIVWLSLPDRPGPVTLSFQAEVLVTRIFPPDAVTGLLEPLLPAVACRPVTLTLDLQPSPAPRVLGDPLLYTSEQLRAAVQHCVLDVSRGSTPDDATVFLKLNLSSSAPDFNFAAVLRQGPRDWRLSNAYGRSDFTFRGPVPGLQRDQPVELILISGTHGLHRPYWTPRIWLGDITLQPRLVSGTIFP